MMRGAYAKETEERVSVLVHETGSDTTVATMVITIIIIIMLSVKFTNQTNRQSIY